ncbi:MAG: VOC family protein [Pseudomonadota bacterium]
MIELDHLAVSGETLEAARAHVEEALGVVMQPGGEHAVFHTHNALLGLEDGLYLEAVAINRAAPVPDRPRWLDLDRFAGSPRLTNWICRTEILEQALTEVDADFGAPVELQRGDLRWRMAVPRSGVLPFDNLAPALMQWETHVHPARLLEPTGVRLRRLTLSHPKAHDLRKLLAPVFSDERIDIQSGGPSIHAEFDTPHGLRALGK